MGLKSRKLKKQVAEPLVLAKCVARNNTWKLIQTLTGQNEDAKIFLRVGGGNFEQQSRLAVRTNYRGELWVQHAGCCCLFSVSVQ